MLTRPDSAFYDLAIGLAQGVFGIAVCALIFGAIWLARNPSKINLAFRASIRTTLGRASARVWIFAVLTGLAAQLVAYFATFDEFRQQDVTRLREAFPALARENDSVRAASHILGGTFSSGARDAAAIDQVTETQFIDAINRIILRRGIKELTPEERTPEKLAEMAWKASEEKYLDLIAKPVRVRVPPWAVLWTFAFGVTVMFTVVVVAGAFRTKSVAALATSRGAWTLLIAITVATLAWSILRAVGSDSDGEDGVAEVGAIGASLLAAITYWRFLRSTPHSSSPRQVSSDTPLHGVVESSNSGADKT